MSFLKSRATVVSALIIIALAAVAAGIILIDGCGDDGDSTDTRETTAATTETARTAPVETTTSQASDEDEAAPQSEGAAGQATDPSPAPLSSAIEISGPGCSYSGCRGTGEMVGTANPGDPILFICETNGDVVSVNVIIVNEDTSAVVDTIAMVNHGILEGGPTPGWTSWQVESITPPAGHYYFYMEAIGAGTSVSNGDGYGMPMYVG